MTSGSDPRRADALARLRAIAADLSGCRQEDLTETATFLQLGFDSLFMTQLASTYKQAFGIGLTFRQLIDEYPSLGALADYIGPRLPQAAPAAAQSAAQSRRRSRAHPPTRQRCSSR